MSSSIRPVAGLLIEVIQFEEYIERNPFDGEVFYASASVEFSGDLISNSIDFSFPRLLPSTRKP